MILLNFPVFFFYREKFSTFLVSKCIYEKQHVMFLKAHLGRVIKYV